jgi:hypothetical protein
MSLVLTPYGIFRSSASEKFPCKPVKDSISSTVLGKGLGNLPWWSFLKMSLVLTPYGIFRSSASEKFPCKPVKDSISSNSVG